MKKKTSSASSSSTAAASSSKKKKAKLSPPTEDVGSERTMQVSLDAILQGQISVSNSQLVSLTLKDEAGSLLACSLFPFCQIGLSSAYFPLLREPNPVIAARGVFALLQNGRFDPTLHPGVVPDILSFCNQVLTSAYDEATKWYALHAACAAINLSEEATGKLFAKHFGKQKWWANQPPSLEQIHREFRALQANNNNNSAPALLLPQAAAAVEEDERVVDFNGIPLLRAKSSPTTPSFASLPDTCKTNLSALAFALHSTSASTRSRAPILIRGLPGCGKTWTVRTLAALLGQELIELQLDDQMDAKTLLGSMTCVGQKFTWVPGTLTRAIAEGKWVLIEDLDSAPQEILTSLKPLFETGELGLPNRSSFYPLRAHANFRVFATSRKSNEAFLVHRIWKSVDMVALNQVELIKVCLAKFTNIPNPSIVQKIVETHFDLNASSTGGRDAEQDAAQNIRDLFKWFTRVAHFVPQLPSSGFITERQREALVREGLEVLTSRLPVPADRINMARRLAVLWDLVPEVGNKLVEFTKPEFKFEASKVWSCGRVRLADFPKSRLPLEMESFAATSVSLKTLEQIAGCVALNEPCLLVGETGCGKTSMIQLLAKCLGKQLVVQNMHVQSDATEFLGGFKPSPSLLKEGLALHDRFLELFPFDKLANAPFLLDVQQSCENQNWKRFCKALEDACKKYFKAPALPTPTPPTNEDMDAAWTTFSKDVSIFKAKIHVNFSFVEGALIRAIRNGDWLLLDEVNLASGETLERLLPLLEDSKSSISLTERGDSTPIPRHPGFRLFAAMNPSTDFGKKNLPTAFRSRFSEFYVDEVNEEADLTLVVSQFLQPDCLDLVDCVVMLFLQAKAMSKSVLFDGSGQSPRYSLRTLVRTLQSARLLSTNQGQFAMPRSIYESFCAHFTTCLDERCAQLLMLEAGKLVVNTKLQQFFVAKKPSAAELVTVQHKKDRVKIGPFYVPIGTLKPAMQNEEDGEPTAGAKFVLTNHVKQNLVLVARAVAFRKYPILLQGPTSAGKTSLITHLAALTGNRVLRINNHEHTDLQEYVGSYVSDETTGKLKFQYGVLVEALQKGYWVILDELNLAPSDVLEALNRLLDDNRELFIMETQEVIKPHANFLLFATQNPPSYGGRKQLSRAFRNRFLEIHFGDIPYTELEEILKSRSRLPEAFTVKMVDVMRELQIRRSKSKLFAGKTGLITPRDLLRWADRHPATYQELAEQGYRLLGERLRTAEERLEVQQVIETCCRVKLDLDQMYLPHALMTAMGKSASVVWTKSMRRVFSLVHACVQNSEPVLLVGETGLGKTKCVAAIAECFNNKLTVLNCHQNTETADILGNLRPVRHHHDTTAAAAGEEEGDKASAKLFEWSDGPLVRTMREGSYFLLDEISLAEDAVLERLNSVLEPGRTLTLAERASGAEVDEIQAKPEFRIFATMNPGGDFGKRELSPALRNRFTEVWIPNDVLCDADLVLQHVLRAHPQATELAQRIVEFAAWFNDNCGTSLQPLSIRDLIAWAEFILATSSTSPGGGDMFAHGCFLTVLDGLGVGAGGTQRAFKEAFLQNCRERFPEIFVHVGPRELVLNDETVFGMTPFFIPRRSVVPVSFEFEASTTQLNLFRVMRALQLPRRAILLEGSPGVGKTSLVSMLAKAIGKNIVRINLSEHTDFSDLIGCDLPAPVDATTATSRSGKQKMAFKWSDGVFLKALKRGDWVLLDELNLANQSVLEGLNSVLDHRACVFVPELNQTFDCPSEFRVFACQNPFAQGGGRKGLPKSFLNRFTKVFVEALEERDYLAITRKVFPQVDPQVLLTVVQSNELLRQTFSHQQDGGDFNLRDVFRFCSLLDKYPANVIFDLLYASRPFFKRRGIDLPPSILLLQDGQTGRDYDQITSLSSKQISFGANCVLERKPSSSSSSAGGRGGLFPPSLTPVLIHLARCVKENWPVLLVGDSGFGKSAVIQRLASLLGQQVRICQMTATTDSTELLGCFEQVDDLELKRNLLIQLEQALLVQQQQNIVNLDLNAFLPKLHLVIGELLVSSPRTFTPEQCFQTGVQFLPPDKPSTAQLVAQWSASSSGNALGAAGFHWVDGALINAMERGEWLVLDDANLCSPTVLDRLNGLLESDGELMVNEQGTTSEGMRVVKPAPGFRIFLTLDPKFGNVSRAMRNRCVEIGLHTSCFQPKSLDRVLFVERFPASLQQDLVENAAIKPHLFAAAAMEAKVRDELFGKSAAASEHEQPFGSFPTALTAGGLDLKHDAFVANLRVVNRMVQQQYQRDGDLASELALRQALLGDAFSTGGGEDWVLFGEEEVRNAFAVLLPLLKRLRGSDELAWFAAQVQASAPLVHAIASLFLHPGNSISWKQELEALSGVKAKFKLLSEVLHAFDAWTNSSSSYGNKEESDMDLELATLRDDLFRVCEAEDKATLLVCWRRFCKRIALSAANPTRASGDAWMHFNNAMARFDQLLQSRTGHTWQESKTRWPIWKQLGHPQPPTDSKSFSALKQLVGGGGARNGRGGGGGEKETQAWRRDALAALCVLRFAGSGGGGGGGGNGQQGNMGDVDALREASLATVLHGKEQDEHEMEVEDDGENNASTKAASLHVSKVVKRVLFLLESKVIQSTIVAQPEGGSALELKPCERLIELAIQTDSIPFEKLAAFQEYIWNPSSSTVLIHEMLANSLLEPELTQASITNEISAFLNLPTESLDRADALERCELMIHALHQFPKSTASDLESNWAMVSTLYDATKPFLIANTTTAAAPQLLERLIAARQNIGKAFALLGFVRFQLFVPPSVDPEKKKQVKMDLYARQLCVLRSELLALRATKRVMGACSASELAAVEQRIALVELRIAKLGKNGAGIALARENEFFSYSQRVQSFTKDFAREERFVALLDMAGGSGGGGVEQMESFYDTLKEFAQSVWTEDRALLCDLVEPFVGAVALALHGLRIVINERKATTTSRERALVHSLIAWPRSAPRPNLREYDMAGLVDANKRAKLNTLLVLLTACERDCTQDLSQLFVQLTAQWRADRLKQEERRAAKEAMFKMKEAKTPEEENAELEAKELAEMFPDFHTEFETSGGGNNNDNPDGFVDLVDNRKTSGHAAAADGEDEKEFAALSADQVETLVESFLQLYKHPVVAEEEDGEGEVKQQEADRATIFRQSYMAASLLEPNVVIGDNLSDQAVLASNLYALTEYLHELKQ